MGPAGSVARAPNSVIDAFVCEPACDGERRRRIGAEWCRVARPECRTRRTLGFADAVETVPVAGAEVALIAEDWAHQLVDGVDMIEPDQVPELVCEGRGDVAWLGDIVDVGQCEPAAYDPCKRSVLYEVFAAAVTDAADADDAAVESVLLSNQRRR